MTTGTKGMVAVTVGGWVSPQLCSLPAQGLAQPWCAAPVWPHQAAEKHPAGEEFHLSLLCCALGASFKHKKPFPDPWPCVCSAGFALGCLCCRWLLVRGSPFCCWPCSALLPQLPRDSCSWLHCPALLLPGWHSPCRATSAVPHTNSLVGPVSLPAQCEVLNFEQALKHAIKHWVNPFVVSLENEGGMGM